MKYLRICLATFLLMGLFAVSNISSAADWYYAGRSATGHTYFIDNDSVKKNSREAMMWVRVVDVDGTASLYMIHVDRSSRMMRYLSGVEYNKSGDVVASQDRPTAWKPIAPESMMDLIFDLIW